MSTVTRYVTVIFIGKERFYKPGWRKGGQALQLLHRPNHDLLTFTKSGPDIWGYHFMIHTSFK